MSVVKFLWTLKTAAWEAANRVAGVSIAKTMANNFDLCSEIYCRLEIRCADNTNGQNRGFREEQDIRNDF